MNFSCFVSAPRLLLGAALCGLTATVSSAAPVQFGVLACNVEPGSALSSARAKAFLVCFTPGTGGRNTTRARSAASASTLAELVQGT